MEEMDKISWNFFRDLALSELFHIIQLGYIDRI